MNMLPNLIFKMVDLTLNRIFEYQQEGFFYIDVGAHYPKRFSNTYFFIKKIV